MTPLLDHALRYAVDGLEVFPVRPDTKAPYTTRGFYDATSDSDQIERWWRQFPDALIGCRIPVDVVVLDVDPRHQGHKTWAELEACYGPIACTRVHASGRGDGGRHNWFLRGAIGKLSAKPLHEWARSHGVGEPTGKSGRSWTSGIDVLHHDWRYTILPPSPHPTTGKPYEWVHEGAPSPLPGFLAHHITRAAVTSVTALRPPSPIDDSIADWYTANHAWVDILPRHGWTLVEGDGDSDGSKWRHPTATAAWSASIKHGCLFVYTPNTEFEETEEGDAHGYTRFRAYAELEHAGDLKTAAKACFEKRDGPPAELKVRPTVLEQPTADDDSDVWPDPIPLGDAHDCPPFPVDALPDWIADHARQVADEFQFPPDLPAMLAITALSICCARRAEVVVQGTWREPLNTYLATAMPPGAGKSPAVKAMLGCLDEWEAQLVEETARDRDEHETRKAILEKAKTKHINNGETAEALTVADELRELGEVVIPRLMADDATPEKLTEMLGEQGGRMALVSTEGGVFGLMTGRYSDKVNLNVYLQAWSGDPIRVDRIGRKSSVVLHPALTVGVTVQPSVIADLAEHPELAGRGLTARIMYAFPPSNVGYRDMGKPPAIDPSIARRYANELVALADRMKDGDRTHDIALDSAAHAVYVAWRQDMEDRCRPGADLHHMTEWVTKLGSTVARLAGLIALAEGSHRIDGGAMQRAVEIGRYWEMHAKIAHDMWGGDPTTSRAGRILDWVASEGVETFTLRDACRAHRNYTTEDVADAVRLLVDNYWLRSADGRPIVAGKRGVPSPEVTVTPKLSQFRNNHVPMSPMSPRTISSSYSLSPFTLREGVGDRDMTDMRTWSPSEPDPTLEAPAPVDKSFGALPEPVELF